MKYKYIHIAIIILGVIFLMLGAFHTNIWFDESYTVGLVGNSITDMWKIASNDVHPPLYYYMLKPLNLIFGNNILIYRLFSIVPILILGILGYTHIRKDFGEKTGLIFSFLVFFLPGITRYATEIRMYSWAMLFGGITAIYAYRLYKSPKFSIKDLIIFGIFSLFSAYTHYYGLMLSGLINLALFIYLLKNFKEKKKDFVKYIICAVTQVILYLPWLMIFLAQYKQVRTNVFWIDKPTFPKTWIELLTVQMSGYHIKEYVALPIVILLLIYIFFLMYKEIKAKNTIKPAILCVIIYIAVILAAYIISMLMVSSILLHRYMLCATALWIFFVSFFMSKEKKKSITIGICLCIFIVSCFNTYNVMRINYDSSNNEAINYIDENIKEDDILIIYADQIDGFAITTRYSKNTKYFHNPENWGIEEAYQAFGPNLKIINSMDEIMNECSGRIWLINIQEENLRNEIEEKYDVNVIERKEFNTAYNNTFYSFTLVEK